ncbi:MAG TPA: phospholipase D-like domain-containing protein, partial [Chloroflexaceae bacterium]|nr:phospholipase D-like domain-containing protein [Chloroflexaceae bacterium]
MPRIFDNIEQSLLPALRQTLEVADRADFCVGYFNLRGWKQIDSLVDRWPGGPGRCCRLLVGMQRLPGDELRAAMRIGGGEDGIDNQTALRLKRRLAEEFRSQLTIGVPTDADEAGLRRLAAQIRARKVVVKLFLRHTLHAKLYLLHRTDPVNPIVGYLGSSNLTFSGLSSQGELNIDVLDHDAATKLARWFDDRWNDRWCVDISDELAQIIEESWARETLIPPYHIYVKMAYHLSREARDGLVSHRIPRDIRGALFEFQTAAVQIAAHHVKKRGGVLIGDVVGLGKTLMATAVVRVFEEEDDLETLFICPKNLQRMWEDNPESDRLRAR